MAGVLRRDGLVSASDMPEDAILATHVRLETKRAFEAMAKARGVTKSVLLREIVNQLVRGDLVLR
jgi:hypothetical protein